MVAPFTLTVIPDYSGQGGKSVQVAATEDGVELGQKLRPSDSPSFEGMTILSQFTVECLATLNAGLLVTGDAIFNGAVDACGALNVKANNIRIGNADFPTDLTADGGGLTLASDTGGVKTFLWLNALDAWALNQGLVVQDEMSVGAVTAPTAGASLDLKAIDKAFLPNRLTTIKRDELAAVAGMQVYNTTLNDMEVFNGTQWKSMGAALVGGPASATDNAVMRFDGTTGKLAQNSGMTVNDAGNVVISGDLLVQGTTTALDSVTLLVAAKNIELGNVVAPTDITADNGGLILKSATGDKTILWLNATDRWTFNQSIDLLGNNLISTGLIAADIMIASAQLIAGNLRLNGNTLSSDNANGDIILTPNGTGKVAIGNLRLTSNTIEPLSGGVFAFTVNAFQAGLDAVEFVEIGHGGGSGFINTVGDGGLDLRFEGVTKATFTDFGHLHLLTDVDQKHTLKIVTANNANDTGLAWENSGGSFTHTIFRTDIGGNRADLIFAGGQSANIDLLTNSFKIHGSAADAGKLEILGALQISSGVPGLDKVLTSDVNGLATWQPTQATAGGWADDGTVVRLATVGDDVGIGTPTPDASAKLDVVSTTKGFLSPRMTETERDDIVSPATGLKIYNTIVDKYEIFTGAVWKTFLTEDLGTVVAQETFASTNARFFGELALPAAQGWTDTATGSATIDLFADTVFGEPKQVVRHNDNVTNGSTTSLIVLTLQNWTDINNFGASFSGISRLDAVSGAAGFFVGLQADAADNPLATGNRRYGLTFANVLGNLKITEPSGTTITFDGTGGSPLIASDEFFAWECVVPPGLGASEFFINKLPTTFAPTFITNAGGLGTSIRVSSGSTSGTLRVTYHDNFGVTIFEEAATKTLLAATMAGDVAQINIPEGKRDYTIILPDGSPRAIGATLRLVANNVLGLISLENQNPAAPQILYNGLRTLVVNVFVKEIIEGINTVDQGNVYLGFKAEDIDRAKSIFAQLSSSVNQEPTDTNPTIITFNTQDEINGIGHSTSLNPGELEILPGTGGVYFVSPQPQVGKSSGGSAAVDLDLFWEVDRGSGFADEPNSNIKITIQDTDITATASSGFTITLKAGDKIRMLQRVSNSTVGLGLKNTDPEVGPPTVPRTPSIILTMHRVGGITA